MCKHNHDKLWLIKSQPYWLNDMFADDPGFTSEFVHGTVYQGYLSALSYHRWHNPVDGKIVKVPAGSIIPRVLPRGSILLRRMVRWDI